MNPKLLIGLGLLGVAVAGTAVVLAVHRAPSVLDRLRRLPQDLSAAYREREAELRAALLPDDDTVAAARADVAARRSTGRGFGATTGAVSPDDGDEDLPYEF